MAVPPPPPSGTGLRPDAVHMPRRQPPPPPRLPVLAERSPRRHALRRETAAAVTQWARRSGVSIEELREVWGESASVVHDRLTGEKPLPIEHVLALPPRQRAQLLALLDDVASRTAA